MQHSVTTAVLLLVLLPTAALAEPAPPPERPRDGAAAEEAIVAAAQADRAAELPYPSTPMLGLVLILPPGDDDVQVVHVVPGGPAEAAGIVAGDRLRTIDGQPIPSPERLRVLLRQRRAGDRVELNVVRDGREETRWVTLAQRERSRPAGEASHADRAPSPPAPAAVPDTAEPSSAPASGGDRRTSGPFSMDEVTEFVEEQTRADRRYEALEQRYDDLRREVEALKRELDTLRRQPAAAPPDPPAVPEEPAGSP